MEMESMSGKMDERMMVIGNMEKCMGGGYTYGKMAESMKESTTMIKSMVQENIIGQMAKDLREGGYMEKDKGKELCTFLMEMQK